MSNSPLVSETLLSPYSYGPRTKNICRITPHIAVGQVSAETILSWFYDNPNHASANYVIGDDGTVGLSVNEASAAQTSNSKSNDEQAVTIECASNAFPPYALREEVFDTLVSLCVDICKRNGKTKLIWIPDKDEALKYSLNYNEMLMTAHRWFTAVECPGDWLYCKNAELAERVTASLQPKDKIYCVQVGAFKNYDYAEKCLQTAKELGFDDAFIWTK